MDSAVSHEKGDKLVREVVNYLVTSKKLSLTSALNFTYNFLKAPVNALQSVQKTIKPYAVEFMDRYIGIYAGKQLLDWYTGRKTLQQAVSLANIADHKKAAIGAFMSMIPKAKADSHVPFTKYSPQYIRYWQEKQAIKRLAAAQDKALENGPPDTGYGLARMLWLLGTVGYGAKQIASILKH